MAETAEAAHSRFDMARAGEAAMALAEQRGWNDVSLRDVARAAGLPLAELYRHCPSKPDLLAGFSQSIDAEVAESIDPEDLEEPAKDRLFEALMERFDHLRPYRKAIRSILDCYRRDPAQALGGLAQLRRSMRRMLELADLTDSGLRGELRLDGLCGVYLYALRAFMEDDSEDLSRTMAALDRALQRIERPAQVLEGRERPDRLVRARVGDELAKRGLARSRSPQFGAPLPEETMAPMAGPDEDGPQAPPRGAA